MNGSGNNKGVPEEWHALKRFLFREVKLARVWSSISRPSPTGDRHGRRKVEQRRSSCRTSASSPQGRVHGVSRNTTADANGGLSKCHSPQSRLDNSYKEDL